MGNELMNIVLLRLPTGEQKHAKERMSIISMGTKRIIE